MTRFILPIILIAISVSVFFVLANPFYGEITALRAQVDSYNQALDNSKALERERDKLTLKKNSIAPENLEKLAKFLPENIDNIRLILEIEQIAVPYDMVLKDVKYNVVDTKKEGANKQEATQSEEGSTKEYGVWDLEFSTEGTYSDFLNFTRDLESNLRIVDISSIQFSSDTSANKGSSAQKSDSDTKPDTYKYDFKIKTYWLKN